MGVEAKAVAKYIRIAPRKVRMVSELVRGKSVEDALNLLHFTSKRGTVPVEKALRSAVANAMNKEEASKLDPESLYIKEICVDEGPTMKRFSPGPMGRAGMIRKRSCHISVVVSNEPVKA
jgi:large subunit ribosomal protein L22